MAACALCATRDSYPYMCHRCLLGCCSLRCWELHSAPVPPLNVLPWAFLTLIEIMRAADWPGDLGKQGLMDVIVCARPRAALQVAGLDRRIDHGARAGSGVHGREHGRLLDRKNKHAGHPHAFDRVELHRNNMTERQRSPMLRRTPTFYLQHGKLTRLLPSRPQSDRRDFALQHANRPPSIPFPVTPTPPVASLPSPTPPPGFGRLEDMTFAKTGTQFWKTGSLRICV